MELASGLFLVFSTLIGLFLFGVVYVVNIIRSSREENVQKVALNPPQKKERKRQTAQHQAPKQSVRKKQEKWSQNSKHTFTHPWLLTSLKGHSGEVLDMDFSANGKFIASCADDRSVFIWSAKDWNNSNHKFARLNVDFDHATNVRWSPDSRAVIIHKDLQNCIEVYKVGRRPDGWVTPPTKAATFKAKHDKDIVGLDIAVSGRFIMTCSEGTDLILWDLKGKVIHQLDTLAISTHKARISPCGRFIAACGFTPDVKVWEVCFNKNGDFDQVKLAFALSAHSAGVFDFAFTSDSSRTATVSKDGTWAVFNTQIDYRQEEEPRLIVQSKHEVDITINRPQIAITPDGEVVALTGGNTIYLYAVHSGELHRSIPDVFCGPITKILFDATGKFVLVSGDKHIRIFHNATIYKVTINNCEAKLRVPGQSSAMKERLKAMIKEAKTFFKKVKEQ